MEEPVKSLDLQQSVTGHTHARDVAIKPEKVAYHVKKYDNAAVLGQK